MNENSDMYDVAVVGAGPAGMMAAITASSNGNKVILIERNSSAGQKLLLTGNGRCNLTNTASMKDLVDKFGKRGSFFKICFFKFIESGSHGILRK